MTRPWLIAIAALALGCRAPADSNPDPNPTPSPQESVAPSPEPVPSPEPAPSVSPAAATSPTPSPPPRRKTLATRSHTLTTFRQERAEQHPALGAVSDVARIGSGVLAATPSGLRRLVGDGRWVPVPGVAGAPALLATRGDVAWALTEALYRIDANGTTKLADLPDALQAPVDLAVGERVLVAGARTLWAYDQGALVRLEAPPLGDDDALRQVAEGPEGDRVAVTSSGLFHAAPGSLWEPLRLRAGAHGWDPVDVRAAAFDAENRLWVAAPQGVGIRQPGGAWRLIPARELPWNEVQVGALAPCPHGAWFGTDRGALHFDGASWAYRQGRRWLPGDHVRALCVDPDGAAAWFATDAGVGAIHREPSTLDAKAAWFATGLERHARTEFGYTTSVGLETPGETAVVIQRDSDNDGLWTGMHGAAACFAWATTGDPAARQRAERAFEALRFLSEVTQGGEHPAPPGFPARTIRSVEEPDPNAWDSETRDRVKQAERDGLWRIYTPRWPRSADGRWYWKSDTSSDELDGHLFFYAQYYDLVADTDAERARVRETVTAIVDHLLAHELRLHDHAGPTRWANFGPASLNHDPAWFEERALNSLSALSYLAVAHHVSGEARYREAARRLIDEHGYAQNVLGGKIQQGPGTGNQSDDEMAVMGFYTLLLYEQDPALLDTYRQAFHRYWRHVEPEGNPFFAFAYAASCDGQVAQTPWGPLDLSPAEGWLDDAVEALRRFPLDRVRWGIQHSHRLDLLRWPGERARGARRDGRALPLDERWVEHWNQDPYALDYPYAGELLADGNAYLLPYYLGRYHGFLKPRD